MADPTPTPEPAPKGKNEGRYRRGAARRVDEILRIRIDGAQFHDVVQYAAEKGWGLKDRQIREYMRRADALLVERRDRNRGQIIARRLAQREALYARAVNAADLRTALAVLDSADKLQGLFAQDKEVRELVKTVLEQDKRIRELEGETGDSRTATASTPPPAEGAEGATGPDPGEARGEEPGPT